MSGVFPSKMVETHPQTRVNETSISVLVSWYPKLQPSTAVEFCQTLGLALRPSCLAGKARSLASQATLAKPANECYLHGWRGHSKCPPNDSTVFFRRLDDGALKTTTVTDIVLFGLFKRLVTICYFMYGGSFRLLALIQPHGWDPVSYYANTPIEYAAC